MHSVKTSGIVLKGTNFGEADKILTVFSERFGKIRVMAKGIRKIKSHLAGALEPFILSEIQLHEGKTFYLPTGAAIIEDFPNIHSNLKKSAKAFFLGELVDRFAEENHKLSDLFILFKQALEFLEENDRSIYLRAFELKIIEVSGFKPELSNCIHCKNALTAGDNFWDGVEGGVICQSCQQKFHHGRTIADETIKLFRFIEASDFAKINCLKLKPEVEDEAERILSEYIRNILERELKSEKFLKMIE